MRSCNKVNDTNVTIQTTKDCVEIDLIGGKIGVKFKKQVFELKSTKPQISTNSLFSGYLWLKKMRR